MGAIITMTLEKDKWDTWWKWHSVNVSWFSLMFWDVIDQESWMPTRVKLLYNWEKWTRWQKGKFKSMCPTKSRGHSPSPVHPHHMLQWFNRRRESHDYVKFLNFLFFNVGNTLFAAVRKVGSRAKLPEFESQATLSLTAILGRFSNISRPWFSPVK